MADDLVEVAVLLLIGAQCSDEPQHGRVHVQGHGRARTPPGDRPDHGHVRRHVEPEPPMRARHGRREQALPPEIAPAVDGIDRVAVVYRGAGRDRLAREPRRALDDRPIGGHQRMRSALARADVTQ